MPSKDRQMLKEPDISTLRKIRGNTPRLFKVLMHNDDYTTMEFVVHALETVFHKSSAEAYSIMLNIHLKGVGICGEYPFDVAETKVEKVHSMARNEGFPLKCSTEEV